MRKSNNQLTINLFFFNTYLKFPIQILYLKIHNWLNNQEEKNTIQNCETISVFKVNGFLFPLELITKRFFFAQKNANFGEWEKNSALKYLSKNAWKCIHKWIISI